MNTLSAPLPTVAFYPPPPRLDAVATMVILLGLVATLLFSGCATRNVAALARSLKDDPAIVSAKVTTIYGTAQLTRVGGQTNSVTVSPDGTITVNK